MLKFTPIAALDSNYIWIVENTHNNEAYVVDPGESEPALRYLKANNLSAIGVLITHSHWDHVGGLDAFLRIRPCPVYGPECRKIPQVTNALGEADSLALWPDFQAEILHLPGHLPEHIGFYLNGPDCTALLCGDVLFSAGCGRNFVGPASDLHASLMRIAALPEDTVLYCSHEYTCANLAFANWVEPDNTEVQTRQSWAQGQRDKKAPTLPTDVGTELKINPFLRCDEPSVRSFAENQAKQRLGTPAEVFAVLRKLKDQF